MNPKTPTIINYQQQEMVVELKQYLQRIIRQPMKPSNKVRCLSGLKGQLQCMLYQHEKSIISQAALGNYSNLKHKAMSRKSVKSEEKGSIGLGDLVVQQERAVRSLITSTYAQRCDINKRVFRLQSASHQITQLSAKSKPKNAGLILVDEGNERMKQVNQGLKNEISILQKLTHQIRLQFDVLRDGILMMKVTYLSLKGHIKKNKTKRQKQLIEKGKSSVKTSVSCLNDQNSNMIVMNM